MNKHHNKNVGLTDRSKSKPVIAIAPSISPKQKLLLLGLLLIITAGLYVPALKNEFNNWDDEQYFVENPNIALNSANIRKSFLQGETHRMYVPLTALSNSINYHFSGLNPRPYILTNIIIHLFNIILVFVFISLLIKNPFVAFAVTALFALHPMQVESVAFASGRRDILYVLFYLLCLIFYIAAAERRKGNWIQYALSIVFAMLAMLSKGQALTIPFTLILIGFLMKYDFRSRRFWLRLAPFFLIMFIVGYKVFIAPRYASPDYTSISYLDNNLPVFYRLVYACHGFVQYIILLLVPYKLALVHPYPAILDKYVIPATFYLYVFLFAAIVFVFFRYALKSRYFWFGLAFFAVNIAMLLQLIPNSYGIMNDHYVYLACLGIFVLICERIALRFLNKKNAVFIYSSFIFYLAILGIISNQRIHDFKNSMTIWNDVIKKYPESDLAYNNRGVIYGIQGLTDLEIQDYKKSITLNPKNAEAHRNIGKYLNSIKKYSEAIDEFNIAIKINPGIAIVYNDRGFSYSNLNSFKQAIDDYKSALQLQPNLRKAFHNLEFVYVQQGLYDKVIEDYTQYIVSNSDDADAYNNRGLTWQQKGLNEKACTDFREAAQLGSKLAKDNIARFCK
jgi:protein O-mannosyl-transferase